ncbi:MAG: VIT1/CCC1 transporter family protein [Candidatus Omnitrophica bacterium]|nr:VIT1/CCC1 transporter family protein [Candidatus Omnitrophota bacterium]MBU1047081.1 VIT1/CCC1 transporter family protein [Candidatus Omnitrophota bacterium]MBU1630563.1 VIT1/CCC1 transporter family protein [Candidatus Omnitrophota bacterium]MBU1767145.1 VIT1/CCC1 transporter family protein [Candidatus Omnitrophota bacterium]MBU1888747.1 VIT1/CCC1 transporter family protein [Candidatus Omnitrophota bacterium]
MLPEEIKSKILTAQRNEITEYFIYRKLSESIKEPQNKEILKHIAEDELKHYNIWKGYTKEELKPSKLSIWKYSLISRIFGITFGTKLMEKGEERAQISYEELSKFVPDAKDIEKDENEHEKKLIGLINEERLKYVGSMVLGLNDALVELTGALAGFTLALQNARQIAAIGLITGIAASLSMAASEYISTKTEAGNKNPVKASVYTGIAYVCTVFLLILPYLIFSNYYLSLAITLFNAILVIAVFTFYVSVAQDIPFKARFTEMATISLGVAVLSFGIGFLIRIFFGVDV